MSNTIRHRRTCQTWQKKDCRPADFIVNDPVKQIEAFPKKHKKLLNYILELENKNYKEVYPNQTTLGNVMNCGRQRANEIVGELQEIGLIVTNYRHMDSCLYKTSSFLRSPFMAQKLSHIFPSLKKLLLLLAIPCFVGYVEGEATQLNLENYNVIGNIEVYKNILVGMARMHHGVNKYSPFHQCLSKLRLTLRQKCVLAAFPEWLIDQALFKITDMSRIIDIGSYLYDYCIKRCKNPDWVWSSQLKDLYGNEIDYEKMPLLLSDDEIEDAYRPHVKTYSKPYDPNYNKKSGGKFPQKERQERTIAEPRRSPGGISPARPEDIAPRDPQLLAFFEFQKHITVMKRNLLKIGVSEQLIDDRIRKLKEEQNILYSQLTVEQRMEYKQQRDIFNDDTEI